MLDATEVWGGQESASTGVVGEQSSEEFVLVNLDKCQLK